MNIEKYRKWVSAPYSLDEGDRKVHFPLFWIPSQSYHIIAAAGAFGGRAEEEDMIFVTWCIFNPFPVTLNK